MTNVYLVIAWHLQQLRMRSTTGAKLAEAAASRHPRLYLNSLVKMMRDIMWFIL